MENNVKHKGKDVSKWNPYWTPYAAQESGDDFVIIRAGFGAGNMDGLQDNHYQLARNAGIMVGAYWFSYAYDEVMAVREANHLLKWAKGKQIEYPLIFDYEYDSRNFCYVSTDMINRMTRAFCGTIEDAGYYAMFYANHDYYFNVFDEETKRRHACWYARYLSESYKDIPSCQLWQWTNKEKMRANFYDGDYDLIGIPELIRKRGLNHLNGYSADGDR